MCLVTTACAVVAVLIAILVRTTPTTVARGHQRRQRQQTALAGLTDPRGATVVPGIIWDVVTERSPYLRLETYVDNAFVWARVSTTFAGLYVPGRIGSTVNLQLVVSSLTSSCSSARAQYTGARADMGAVVVSALPLQSAMNATEVVIGLAPERVGADGLSRVFVSPVLDLLRREGKPVEWCFNVAHRPKTYLSLTIPEAACFPWCWSAMDTSQGLYVIELVSSSDAPWPSAVLDIGRWQSILPASSAVRDENQAVLLTTPAGCTFFIRPGTYTVEYSQAARCVLGISAGLSGGALAVDLTNYRLGYVAVTPVTVLS